MFCTNINKLYDKAIIETYGIVEGIGGSIEEAKKSLSKNVDEVLEDFKKNIDPEDNFGVIGLDIREYNGQLLMYGTLVKYI